MKDLDGGNCPSMIALERSQRSLSNEVARVVVCLAVWLQQHFLFFIFVLP
jgi:hypothetical protein